MDKSSCELQELETILNPEELRLEAVSDPL